MNTLAAAQIVAGPSAGQGVAAEAGHWSITTTPLFNALGPSAQATVLIHETFHLVPYGFTDVGLAETTGWKVPEAPKDTDVPGLASAAFTKELAKHCGW